MWYWFHFAVIGNLILDLIYLLGHGGLGHGGLGRKRLSFLSM